MKTIYRIENSDKQGIFRNNLTVIDDESYSEITDKLQNRHQTHMTVATNCRCFEVGVSKCAYHSIKQLRRMVTLHELIKLEKLGFKAVEIQVKRCHIYKGYHKESQRFYKEEDVISRKRISG